MTAENMEKLASGSTPYPGGEVKTRGSQPLAIGRPNYIEDKIGMTAENVEKLTSGDAPYPGGFIITGGSQPLVIGRPGYAGDDIRMTCNTIGRCFWRIIGDHRWRSLDQNANCDQCSYSPQTRQQIASCNSLALLSTGLNEFCHQRV